VVHVCCDWFPLTDNPKDRRKEPGFDMNELLKEQLDVLIKNVVKDWDFTIIISGQGEMRVGKSIIGMQIGCYWSYQIWKLYGIKVPWNVKENFVLNGSELIAKGNALGQNYKYAVLDYDEAADDLESSKVLKFATQQIKDHLRKAAQYNMLNIIIQSEFFEVPKAIALSRSTFLIDVYYVPDERGYFNRGYFHFFSRRGKKKLYLFGKKELDYNCVIPDFRGTFPNFFTVPEDEYRKEKRLSLNRWHKVTALETKMRENFRAALKLLYQMGLTHREIAEKMSAMSKFRVSHVFIGAMIAGEEYNEDEIVET
jgi:hypothetical protein